MRGRAITNVITAGTLLGVAALAGLHHAVAAVEPAKVGTPAPGFEVKDIDGKVRKLSEFGGKIVVLEWHNQGCPFVKKHYESGNMQKLQQHVADAGGVWLTVISSAPGKQGHVTPAEETKYLAEQKSKPTAVLLDEDGKVGKLYGAKTTPHMYVVDAKGTLVYAGAIDDKPSTDADDIPGSKNYVAAAFEETKGGKPVTTASTVAYGCSVKYAD